MVGTLVLAAALASSTASATAKVGAEPVRTAAVSIVCSGGVVTVARTEDQPSSKVRITTVTPATCTSVTHPQITGATGNGFATFTGTCSEVTGTLEGTVKFLNSAGKVIFTSTGTATFTAVITANGGVSATISNGSVTRGDFVGALGAGAAQSVAGTSISCLTGTSPQSIQMTGNGSLDG